MEQGTQAWLDARCGKVTASRMADLLAKTKNGPSASRANYMAELIAERLTGCPAERYVSKEMERGTEMEPEARSAYEFFCDSTVTLCGFIDHPTIAMSGASPDGLVGDAGLIEVKNPNTSTHIDMLLAQEIPNKYQLQMQWQMACTGRQWADFVSYDSRLPQNLRLFVKRLERDDAKIKEMETQAEIFLSELDTKLMALQEKAA